MQSLGEPSVNHNDNSTLEYSRAEGWNALSSTRCLIRGGTRRLERVAKTDAALPPDICAFSDKADIVFRRSRSTSPDIVFREVASRPSDFHFFAGVVFCRPCSLVRLFWASIKLGLIRRAALTCSMASEIRPICPRAAPRLPCASAKLGLIRNACSYWSIASEVRPVRSKALPRLLCALAKLGLIRNA